MTKQSIFEALISVCPQGHTWEYSAKKDMYSCVSGNLHSRNVEVFVRDVFKFLWIERLQDTNFTEVFTFGIVTITVSHQTQGNYQIYVNQVKPYKQELIYKVITRDRAFALHSPRKLFSSAVPELRGVI